MWRLIESGVGDAAPVEEGCLAAGFSVVQVAVLPIQPGMSKLMGKDVSSARDRKSFADIDDFGFVVPNPIRVRILPVHLRVGHLADHDVIAERKDDFIWYSHRIPRCLLNGRLRAEVLLPDSLTYFAFPLPC